MTHRERVLKTLRFEKTDRAPYDLMEGIVWPEFFDYLKSTFGVESTDRVCDFLDTDIRWVPAVYSGPQYELPAYALDNPTDAPLRNAHTVAEVEAYVHEDPSLWTPPDFAAARERWPDYELMCFPGWFSLFWTACGVFGMEEALIRTETEPDVFEAFIRKRHAFSMDVVSRMLDAAQGYSDICYLGDDYAGNDSLVMRPDTWRRLIKPYLKEEVELIHSAGMYSILHSCGAIREIIPDLIEIGVNALLVFQTSARGMDAESIARDFGGKIVFYGGVDCMHLLTFGSPDDVRAEVRSNVDHFSKCGGYIVANSHHGIGNMKPENMLAMYEAARGYGF